LGIRDLDRDQNSTRLDLLHEIGILIAAHLGIEERPGHKHWTHSWNESDRDGGEDSPDQQSGRAAGRDALGCSLGRILQLPRTAGYST